MLIISATMFLWYGYQIRYKRHYDLIEGFDSRNLSDPVSWARLSGLLQMLLGTALLLTAIAGMLAPSLSREIGLAFIVAALLAWGPLVTPLQRYENS
jgi:hypothetical protein